MSNKWDPPKLHSSVQHKIPTRKYLPEEVPFAIGWESIVNVPMTIVDMQMYTLIDDTTGLTVDLPRTENAKRLGAAIPLAVK